MGIMSSESQIKQSLKDWVIRKNGKINANELSYNTPLLEERIVASVQLMDLIRFLEHLSGKQIDVTQLKKGVFRDIDTIYREFFAPSA